MRDEYLTMTEIGRLFGVSSHVIGRKLNEIGLRNGRKPSGAAFNGGYCEERWASDLRGYCWAWAKTKTIESLEGAGMKRIDQPPSNAASSDLQPGANG